MAINTANRKEFLVFGGNGFIGFEFVKALLEKFHAGSEAGEGQPGLRLTLLNRFKSWDWDKLSIVTQYGKVISYIKWNRKKPLTDCQELTELVNSVRCFDAVIDFSAYDRRALVESLSLLKDKCLLYVYISTDSIYEVCTERYSGLTRESDSVRPDNEMERRKKSRFDKYGHKKLECEELLNRQQKLPSHIPFVIFRLPDVFGPCDSTHRLWQYILLLKLSYRCNVPMFISEHVKDVKISLVSVFDVASLLSEVVCCESSSTLFKNAANQTFNLSFLEPITIEYLLQQLAAELNIQNIEFKYSSNLDVSIIYPSVMITRPLDSSKAQSMLSWQPLPFMESLKRTVVFYEDVAKSKQFFSEKWKCIDEVLNDLIGVYKVKPLSDRSECLKLLQEMLNV